ncbi:MAG TPA: oxidoreductase, partial [Denitromonas sp.]|nr:oxidoreductase [Denitromonas sp.]
MPKVIHKGQVVADNWQVFRLPEGADAATAAIPTGQVIVPFPVWQVRREELLASADAVGVWLAGSD